MSYLFKFFLLNILLAVSLLSDETIKSKTIYIEYESYPKRVFTGQKFEVVLKLIVLRSENQYDKIITKQNNSSDIELLNNDIVWDEISKNTYMTTLTFKTTTKQFILPNITVALLKDDNIVDFISLTPPEIKFEKIAVDQKLFSNIIASNLEINTVKTKQYNNNILHTTINIEATNSNLADISIGDYKEQGINSLTETLPHENLFYYVMIPSHTKEIKFTYYNNILKQFILITLPITLEEELVSTQTDLNPYESSVSIYKQYGAIVLFFIVLLLFLITKRNLFVVMLVMTIALIGYLYIPNKKIVISSGKKVYILPTINSTVYRILDKNELVSVINVKDNYKKVLFKNENIGWIKDDE